MAPLADILLQFVPTTSFVPIYLKSYIPGQTPLSTWPVVTTALASYLAIIFGIREVMKDRAPQRLNTLFRIHNAFLSLGSALLLALMIEEVASVWLKVGTYAAMCADESWTPRLEFYYMINYYFKYIELLDTVFLALKKKPLPFLHVFHHSATALLCFTQLNGKTSVSWVVISLNLTVHVIMYYYYYATAGGAKIWWKKYLTTMQIVQFVIDLFVVYFGTYQHYANAYWKHLPHVANCAGTESAALFGCGLLSSYLLLFINFYIQTYKKPTKAKSGANGISKGNGVANGKSH
ncbi:GNS1/SUR4 membrane protein [Coniophora puteana RWD-64-598 SS2]|uniref:Elongation of fatty acids protein n=1 Tax=Coniophora puteana (strain RWD-64-598) TaxID=741705 RepID=A0A5M3N6N0_CONPW|nr:GNS1/SUR4 membrane protein [Coniophora puteana RWD-64-598 SS2]EIW86714.1 GNS1/SUR4 membrane protein [Coniophora puteana RWD-64-598 SS2]